MRRARIKVTASVPIRRKIVKVDESEKQDSEDAIEVPTPEEVNHGKLEEAIIEHGATTSQVLEIPETSPSVKVSPLPENPQSPEKIPPKTVVQAQTDSDKEKTYVEAVKVSGEIPRRPRLVSESSDTKGHHSGSEGGSPTKLPHTRTSFMRPTPRLESSRIRRNSIQGSGASASESEDDSRRHSHSLLPPQPPSLPTQSAQSAEPSKPAKSPKKRKMLVSESARKLSEARREFLLKHEHNQPDRTKLTMYDLIYYNPTTNPMKKTSRSLVKDVTEEPQEASEVEDDEDSPLLVPQLKVGPNGEMIVDEQSLVIENTTLKKDREAVARRRVLVDEEGAIGGFYKKRKKSKDWTPTETLKFYKVLNTVGTDFSLMQSVFPRRSRHELKMKFKKEEKLNRALVEKALVYHQEYDVEALKEDLATFDMVEDKDKTGGQKKQRETVRKRRAKRRKVATSVNMLSEGEDEGEDDPGNIGETEENGTDGKENQPGANDENEEGEEDQGNVKNDEKQKNEEDNQNVENEERNGEKIDQVSKPKKRKKCRGRKIVECEEEESVSEDDFEIYKVKPTRSGRVPKKRRFNPAKILDGIFGDDAQETEENSGDDGGMGDDSGGTGEAVEGLQDVEPGSLVIVSKESPDEPGKTIVQVYMVSRDGNGGGESMTPVDLSLEQLSSVTSGLSRQGIVPIKLMSK